MSLEILSKREIGELRIKSAAVAIEHIPEDPRLGQLLRTSSSLEIASHLRRMPQHLHERFMIFAFGPDGLNFPNGAKLGYVLAEINRTPWFAPPERGEVDNFFLHQQADQHATSISFDYDKPLSTEILQNEEKVQSALNDRKRSRWGATIETVTRSRNGLIKTSGIEQETMIVRGLVLASILNIKQKAGGYIDPVLWQEAEEIAVNTAIWTMTEGLTTEDMLHGNPYRPLLEICKKGYLPLGFVPKKPFMAVWAKQVFMVYHPTSGLKFRLPREDLA